MWKCVIHELEIPHLKLIAPHLFCAFTTCACALQRYTLTCRVWQEGWPLQSSGISRGYPQEQAEAPPRDWRVEDLKKKIIIIIIIEAQIQWQSWSCSWRRLRKETACNLKRKQPNTPTCRINSHFYSGNLHFPNVFFHLTQNWSFYETVPHIQYCR